MIHRGSRLRRAALPLVLFIAHACSATVTQPEPALEALVAPMPTRPTCGAVSVWPEQPITLAWQAVANAASYTVEIDCFGCGTSRDPWVSQSGTPWRLVSGLQATAYTFDVASTVRREGGRAMRWRAWSFDARGRESPRSDWCVLAFSADGLPTPGPAAR